MIFKFKDIPCDATFAVFDKDNRGPTSDVRNVSIGDTEFDIEIPATWTSPYRNFRTGEYFVPNAYMPIVGDVSEIVISGGDFYIDVNRERRNEELNRRSIETLIHQIHGNRDVDGRQKFFVSLVSLQSYFEHLVYGMLVLSGHLSRRKFKNLETQAKRIPVAFSDNNTQFFSQQIEICPGKGGLGSHIPSEIKDAQEKTFEKIRKLRNKVVHSWGYKDIGQQEIKDDFLDLGENINLIEPDDAFYEQASFVLVRLYAKASLLNNQLSLFTEKEMVRLERESRGY